MDGATRVLELGVRQRSGGGGGGGGDAFLSSRWFYFSRMARLGLTGMPEAYKRPSPVTCKRIEPPSKTDRGHGPCNSKKNVNSTCTKEMNSL